METVMHMIAGGVIGGLPLAILERYRPPVIVSYGAGMVVAILAIWLDQVT